MNVTVPPEVIDAGVGPVMETVGLTVSLIIVMEAEAVPMEAVRLRLPSARAASPVRVVE